MEDGEERCRKIIQNDALHINKFNYGYLMPSQVQPPQPELLWVLGQGGRTPLAASSAQAPSATRKPRSNLLR